MWIDVCVEIVNGKPCGGHIHEHECSRCFKFMGKNRPERVPNAAYANIPAKDVFPMSYLEGIELENQMLMLSRSDIWHKGNKPTMLTADEHRQNMIPEEYE